MIKVLVNGTDRKEVLEGTVGMTIDVREVNDYDMEGYWMGMHFEALFIDFDYDYVRTVVLDKKEDAEVDCPPEVYEKWFNEIRKPKLIREALDKHHAECERISKGKLIKVVKGRKVPIGAEGVVFWMGEVNYDPYKRFYYATTRIGFKADNGETYWTDVSNVVVKDPSSS